MNTCRECSTQWDAPVNYCPQCRLYLENARASVPSEIPQKEPFVDVLAKYAPSARGSIKWKATLVFDTETRVVTGTMEEA